MLFQGDGGGEGRIQKAELLNYPIENIAEVCHGRPEIATPGSMVQSVIIDHRDVRWKSAVFAAIKGSRHDGHEFIPALLEQGVRHFLVTDESIVQRFKGHANFILVDDMLRALQLLAAHHRKHFQLPLIAITGSNGKTIVKEWLNDLLQGKYRICRSPKSFNSQLGVSLSVFNLDATHTLGLFEAGISKPGEMQHLARILNCTYGLFTNLGDAHAAHFESNEQKFREKWQLFSHAEKIVCSADQAWMNWLSEVDKKRLFAWSFKDASADVFVESMKVEADGCTLQVRHANRTWELQLPYADKASLENAMNCFALIALLGKLDEEVITRFGNLQAVAMRMEVKPGIEQSVIIDDSYNADLESLQAALEQLKSLPNKEKMVILSGLNDSLEAHEVYPRIGQMLADHEVTELVGIGDEVSAHASQLPVPSKRFFSDVNEFWSQTKPEGFRQKAILIKGSRKYKLENLSRRLQAQKHETVLEIDLHKMLENLRYFRSQLQESTKVMVMVKAFSYGSGGHEVASFLQNHNVDYLAVAYADEGVALRQKGVRLPIMVMSPSQASHEVMLQQQLEPEIYSFRSLEHFVTAAKGYRHFAETFPIHIKIDTGMHRLGFREEDLSQLSEFLHEHSHLRVQSIFTHLSASDNAEHDAFTRSQFHAFEQAAEKLEALLGYKALKHALNSTGILRFPEAHYDMVRLGIGLYGFSGNSDDKYLSALGSFKTYIAQLQKVKAGESVGYNRGGISDQDRTIATIAVGYADGLDRRLGDGHWSVSWQGTACPIVGTICMDMCMIDVTHTQAREGDEVVIFSNANEIREMARQLDTIPYEVLTKISQRVRRLYLQE